MAYSLSNVGAVKKKLQQKVPGKKDTKSTSLCTLWKTHSFYLLLCSPQLKIKPILTTEPFQDPSIISE